MRFTSLFTVQKPLIGCIHLLPLPGSPRYQGSMSEVYRQWLDDALSARAKLVALTDESTMKSVEQNLKRAKPPKRLIPNVGDFDSQ